MAFQSMDVTTLREEILDQSRISHHDDDEGLLPDVLDHVDQARDLAMQLLRKMQEFVPVEPSLPRKTQIPPGKSIFYDTLPHQSTDDPTTDSANLQQQVDELRRENARLRSKQAPSKDQSTQTDHHILTTDTGTDVDTQTTPATSGLQATGIPVRVKSSPKPSPLLERHMNSGRSTTLPVPKRSDNSSVAKPATRETSGKKTLSPRPQRKVNPQSSKPGWYRVDTGKKLHMKVVGGNNVVRVGGGWMALREYLTLHTDLTGLTPKQAEHKLDEQEAFFSGKCSKEAAREDSSGAPQMVMLPSNYYGGTQRLHTEDEVEEAFTRVSRASLASHIADVSTVHLRRMSQMRSSASDSSAIAGLDLAAAARPGHAASRLTSPVGVIDGVLGSRERRGSLAQPSRLCPTVPEDDSFH
eukprot:m.30284 g.30284  ORF g.30284 m.30284 type:complete len:412 (+) comp13851_c0_seq1:288-1523(+)